MVDQRVVLAGEHQGPVRVGLAGDPPQPAHERLEVGPAAPLHVEAVLDGVGAGLLETPAREMRSPLVVADVDLGARLLAEDLHEPEHLLGIAVRGD